MPYILYYSPGAASMAVHWMLREFNVAFETRLVDLETSEKRSAQYLQLNPSGRVTTLIIDGVPCGELAALLMLLAERHPEAGLALELASPERRGWLQLMAYLANTVLPAMRGWFYAEVDGEEGDAAAVRAFSRKQIEASMERLDSVLGDGQPFLGGNRLSTADFLGLLLMRWTRNMPRPATSWPHLASYIHRLRATPGFAELNRREVLTDWSESA